MKTAFKMLLVVVSSVLISESFTLSQTPDQNYLSNEVAPDTVFIFNGKNFDGLKFVMRNKDADVKNFSEIKNGELILNTNEVGYFRTLKVYDKYKLHAEWRWMTKNEKGNNGILIHTQLPDTVWPKCLQVQLKDQNAGDLIAMNGITCDETIGKPKDTAVKLSESSENPETEWNSCDVICYGDSLVVFVNGKLQNKASNINVQNGMVGFQMEGKPIVFRNLFLIKQ